MLAIGQKGLAVGLIGVIDVSMVGTSWGAALMGVTR
jgi:hypothetical protein